jgi:hypothetical protein
MGHFRRIEQRLSAGHVRFATQLTRAKDSPLDYIRNGYKLTHMDKHELQLPLTPAVFHILLALIGRERHGYDIMHPVNLDSQGAVKMAPGTLYGSLDRDAGLVAKGDTKDARRIYCTRRSDRRRCGRKRSGCRMLPRPRAASSEPRDAMTHPERNSRPRSLEVYALLLELSRSRKRIPK